MNRCDVDYRFVIDGRAYTGKDEVQLDEAACQAIQIGSPITVRTSVSDPSQSLYKPKEWLTHHRKGTVVSWILSPVLLGFGGVGVCAAAIRLGRSVGPGRPYY
jgi:hypothetical protein